MNRDFIMTSIKSFETRLERCKRLAINDIREGHLVAAQAQLLDAAGYQAIIEEYRLQLDVMEVNGDE